MNRKILSLAIPNVISNITIPLLGLVDIALMGHLDSEIYIGAIAIGSLIFNFIYWGFSFLKMGTSGFTAQSYGKRSLSECTHILNRGLIIAITSGIILMLLSFPIEKISFLLIEGTSEVENLAKEYFYIRIWAAPATLGLMVVMGWFTGMQNAITPMILSITVNVFNIIFSFCFVYLFDMNAKGVALGTVIAQYLGFIMGFIMILVFYKKLGKYVNFKKALYFKSLKEFFKVNTDIFIRTMLLVLCLSFFTSQSAVYGDKYLAANTVLFNLFLVFTYFTDGFAYAAEALTGKYYGAGHKYALKSLVKLLFKWGWVMSIIFSIIFLIFGEHLVSLLTSNIIIKWIVKDFYLWIILIPILSFAAFLWDGIYIGATASKYLRNSMFISACFIFFPTYYLTEKYLSNHSLWLALSLFMLSRGILLKFYSKKAIF